MTMESLDLPRDLYWGFKEEPASPPSAAVGPNGLFALDETAVSTFLYDDNFANGITLLSNEEAVNLQRAGALELLSDEDLVVEYLNLQDLKDEECLLDQKASHYIEYEATNFSHLDLVSQNILPITKGQVAANSSVDLPIGEPSLILQQLTPPQSPPQFDAYQHQQELVKDELKLPYATDSIITLPTDVAYSFNNWPAGSDFARQIQLVDDIVNMRAQELQLPTDCKQLYNDDCESQASSLLECSSGGNSADSSIADADEEWLPESSSSSPAHTISDEHSQPASSASGSLKKRTRTYGRGVEDRKIRKKEQNKNAATRYRQKKKIEMEHVLGEEQELLEANQKLRRTLSDRRHELRYLRQLIREFYQERKQ